MSSIWWAEQLERWCITELKMAPQLYLINTVANQTEQHKKYYQYGKRNNKIIPVMYPAVSKGIYVLNAGQAIRILWSVFKRFLSANLAATVKLVVVKQASEIGDTVAGDGEKGFQTLLEKFPKEILPTFIGGLNDFNKLPSPGVPI